MSSLRRKRGFQAPTQSSSTRSTFEAVVHRGIEDVAVYELGNRFKHEVTVLEAGLGRVVFNSHRQLADLLSLRTVSSLYLVIRMDVPRPRALLGDEALRRLLDQIRAITGLSPTGSYSTLHLSAAGADSPVMRRLAEALASGLGLAVTEAEGDLHIRMRRPTTGVGWEVLVRLTPRPLSARSWRVCNMPGALNACVAAAMVLLAHPRRRDAFFNPCCGSGTLLIEAATLQPNVKLIGCDVSQQALGCAGENIRASGFDTRIELHAWDARKVPVPDASAGALCINLPFGHLLGSHEDNRTLHAEILREAERVADNGARCCLLTHQADLMSDLLRASHAWSVDRRSRIDMGGLLPTLFLVQRWRA